MSRNYKILIAVLSVLIVALGAMTFWLYTHMPAQPPADAAPTQTAAAPETPAAAEPLSGRSPGELVISEFMEKNRAVLRDGDGDFSDWIELYNPGTVPVSIKGWSVSDKESGEGWSFPDLSVDAGEYLLVFASGKDRRGGELHTDFSLSGDEGVYLRDAGGELHTDFSLSGDEGVYLRDAGGELRSSALCGGCDKDVSMAVTADGEFLPSLYPTPGYVNSAEGYEARQNALMPAGPLVINEVMVYNAEYLKQQDIGCTDWVEIKNISGSTVLLSNYWLSDDGDDYRLWQLPGIYLAPGGLTLVLCVGEEQNLDGQLARAPLSLDSENEQLYLSDAGGLVDFISLRDIPCGGSAGRMDGQPGQYFFASPSPGENNRGGCLRVSAKPVSLSADGVFDNVGFVTAELSGAGEIRYTLDGSAPTAKSPLYTEPLSITQTTALRAVCIEPGALPSRPLTLSYIVNEGHTIPVVSLVSDSPGDFNYMYTGAHKDVEMPGSLSYYGEDGSFTIGCGISMNGMTSLTLPKKNMSLRFRGAYGDATLDYDLYGGGVTEFTNLLLRAGQDFNSAIVRNELCQELCAMMGDNVINQRSKFVILYINGSYYGIYTLKEKANEQLYASIAGVSRDSVELVEPPVYYLDSFYQDVIKFAMLNDMTIDANYQHICDLVDIDSLIDFLIIEGFCANTDVVMGNMRFVRSPEADNKWHFEFYDLDSTFIYTGSIYYNLMSGFSLDNIQLSAMIVPLMENERFKAAFLTRAGGLFENVLTNDAVIDTLDRLCAQIAPEVPRDHRRFDQSMDGWYYNLDVLKSLVTEDNWRQMCIDALSDLFALSDTERTEYFGAIDGK